MRNERFVALGALTTTTWLLACSGRLTVLTSDDAGSPDANQTTQVTSGGSGGSSAGGGGSGGDGASSGSGGNGGTTGGQGGSGPGGSGGAGASGGNGGSSTGGDAGAGGAGASGGSGGSSSGGAAGSGPAGAAGSGGMVGLDAKCAALPYDTKVLPHDLLVVANSSSSMDCPWGAPSPGCNQLDAAAPGGATRWSVFSDGFTQAATFLAGRGAALGISFSPVVIAGGTICLGGHEDPLDVELPGSVDAVLKAIASKSRAGSSLLALPIEHATPLLQNYAFTHAPRRPELAVVFDGESDFRPCFDETIERAVTAASLAYQSKERIRTTVIGIGSDLVNLDIVAAAGGTNKARLINTGARAEDGALAVAYALRAAATPCELAFPDPIAPPGLLDPARLNIETALGNGTRRVALYNYPNASWCQLGQGWYYDDPAKPTKVILCPAACEPLSFEDAPVVTFLTGCPTRIAPPPP